MNKFFFISCFDRISSEIISHVLNIHPEVACNTIQTDSLLPQSLPLTIDQFIQDNKTDKKFSGNIYNFNAFEIQHKIISEKTQQPFRQASIVISPILRIRFLIYSWTRVGVTHEQLLQHLHQKLMTNNKNDVLNFYNVIHYYNHILGMVKGNLENLTAQYHANPAAHNPQILADLASTRGRLFFIALAVLVAFDTADFSTSSKKFQFEKLISNENEMINLMNYVTSSQLTITDEIKNQLKVKLQEVNQYLNSIKLYAWEHWQTELLHHYLFRNIFVPFGVRDNGSLQDLYEKQGYSFSSNANKLYSKLVSIHLKSNQPAQLSLFFDNIEETTECPQDIEVVVNIDSNDMLMKTLLNKEMLARKFTIKYRQTDHSQQNYDFSDPQAYFLLNTSENKLFITKGWDAILKNYIRFYPDHIFRLRVGPNKFRNYYNRWEFGFDNGVNFITNEWSKIVYQQSRNFYSDSFQQLTSYYLAKDGAFSYEHFLRDIPVIDIELVGNLPPNKTRIKQSYEMLLEARKCAMLLKANILVSASKITNANIIDEKKKKLIQIWIDNKIQLSISYKLNKFYIMLENLWRKLSFRHLKIN